LDNIIFGIGPLGIITAIVSAFRVAGTPSLKASIGRAQEPPSVAELELLSSTSSSTAELWSDGGIARIFGKLKILEVVRRVRKNATLSVEDSNPESVDSFEVIESNIAWERRDQLRNTRKTFLGKEINSDPENHMDSHIPSSKSRGGMAHNNLEKYLNPNMSMNISIKR
jgi:hypothetical protein